MTVGTSLFTKINTSAFSRIDGKIADLQGKISSGVNDPRASADPVRAARLSVAKEQKQILERFDTNVKHVESRLDQTDSVLSEVTNIMQRMSEIAIRGASETVSNDERRTLRIEVEQLKDNLLDLANSKDDTGGSLFGGFRKKDAAFTQTLEGVNYSGDSGRHRLRVSESADLETGLDGVAVFMSVATEDGQKSAFEIVDDLLFTLSANAGDRETTASGLFDLNVSLDLGRKADTWGMTLTGPGGSATISAEVSAGGIEALIEEINAASGQTGITARLADNGNDLIMSSGGEMSLSNMTTDPVKRSTLAHVTPLDKTGNRVGETQQVVPPHLTNGFQVDTLKNAISHMADQRGAAGALGQVAIRHSQNIDDRMLIMETSRAELEDLDIAKAVTELQRLILNRDVSQQTFVKIAQQSLFDYIR